MTHNGDANKIMKKRNKVYETARKAHPGRWTRKTRDWSLPDFVALNPTKEMKESVQEQNRSV